MEQRELIIVGGGPAGMAAAISAYECGIKDILLLERDQYLGGILNQCIHTGFGLEYFKDILTGPEYADRFIKKVRDIKGIEISLKSFVVKLEINSMDNHPLPLGEGKGEGEKVITYIKPGRLEQVKAKAVIMATGCREKTREMTHIPGTRPSGVFSAGLAQKLINIEGLLPGREVVIIGSGDIGLIMARRFTLEGAKVKAVIEILKESRGLKRNISQCIEDFDIPIYYRHRVSRIYGKDRVEGVDVVNVDESLKDIPDSIFHIGCDTVLMSVGLIPENELLEMAGAQIDKNTNSPVSGQINQTSIPGIFCCGNSYKVYDIADSVTKDSILAGRTAAEYIGASGKLLMTN
ncbi:MAG: FAD-dependent oxidoreductase [Candidatus Saganbacteria bacterium]|nr:FAD-dependent oxidoreductase [Candidatus Saganbacteria bacterium]